MDIPTLMAELHLRGLGQEKADAAFRCLVHVYAVQDFASSESGGVLVDDIVSTYPIEVVQAASELFLEKSKSGGQYVYRVKWGCSEAAKTMQEQLWENTSSRWDEFVAEMNGRYLGFLLPAGPAPARVITGWKFRKDLQWFSQAAPRHGWNIMRMVDDIMAVAWKLDLAFGFRPCEAGQVGGERVLMHEKAFEALRRRAAQPPEGFRTAIGKWRFFSEYDVEATDFVALMRDCDLTLEEVATQVDAFFAKNLTTRYRNTQYPPYFVNQKMKREFQAAVRGLLEPLEGWLSEGVRYVQEVSPESALADYGTG